MLVPPSLFHRALSKPGLINVGWGCVVLIKHLSTCDFLFETRSHPTFRLSDRVMNDDSFLRYSAYELPETYISEVGANSSERPLEHADMGANSSERNFSLFVFCGSSLGALGR